MCYLYATPIGETTAPVQQIQVAFLDSDVVARRLRRDSKSAIDDRRLFILTLLYASEFGSSVKTGKGKICDVAVTLMSRAQVTSQTALATLIKNNLMDSSHDRSCRLKGIVNFLRGSCLNEVRSLRIHSNH